MFHPFVALIFLSPTISYISATQILFVFGDNIFDSDQ